MQEKKVHFMRIEFEYFRLFFFVLLCFYISKWWSNLMVKLEAIFNNQGCIFKFNSLHFILFRKSNWMCARTHTHNGRTTIVFEDKHPWWSMIYWPDKIWKSVLSIEYKFKSIAFVPGVQYFILKYAADVSFSFSLLRISLYQSHSLILCTGIVWM